MRHKNISSLRFPVSVKTILRRIFAEHRPCPVYGRGRSQTSSVVRLATCPTADSCENSSAIFPTLHFILLLCRRQSADSRALKWATAAQRRRMKRWSDHLIWFLFKLICPHASLTLLCLSPSSSPVAGMRGFGACLMIHQLSSGLHEGLALNKSV